MNARRLVLLFAAAVSLAPAALADDALSRLRRAFVSPPAAARPQVWWHWLAGNVSKAGITADLEAMRRVGIGGGTIANIPFAADGPAPFMTPSWREMVKHAGREAERLGMELGFFNCEGWSSSGGPWITPEAAMQMLVWSETRVEQGSTTPVRLPRPHTRLGYYRDVAVLAFPTPAGETARPIRDLHPAMSATGGASVDGRTLSDDDAGTGVTLPEGPGRRGFLDISFAQPVSVTGLRLTPGDDWTRDEVDLQTSEDGVAWRTIGRVTMPLANLDTGVDWQAKLDFPATTARRFRIAFVGGHGTWTARVPKSMALSEVEFLPVGRPPSILSPDSILNVTPQMDGSGALNWTPPGPGSWTVVRFGHTPIGKHSHPITKYGDGLECDKLSKTALDLHVRSFVDKVLSDAGPRAGKTLVYSLIDSYECGEQNWTPLLPAEFRARRGYDLAAYLPALTGRTVISSEITARFQEDFQRTIADLWNANYYGYFADLLHARGLRTSVEAYGNGTFDELRSSGLNDMPMSEFWFGGLDDGGVAKMASSAAHVYGRPIVGAESFTSGAEWNFDPWSMKLQGDWIFSQGVNRYYFHSYAQQPWTDGRKPGWAWGNGIHLTRNLTWFEQGRAWFAYIGRCQALLQAGRFVADVLSYEGENVIHFSGDPRPLRALPPGYDFDGLDRDMLLAGLTVRDGAILTPGGGAYRLLTLPNDPAMSPNVLRRIRDLVQQGAAVFGPRPQRALGLGGAPGSDAEVRRLADELWGPIDGATVTENRLGRGRVFWTGAMDRLKPALDALAIRPDFLVDADDARIRFLHRTGEGADWYFVSNQESFRAGASLHFRQSDRVPELWDPETGQMAEPPVWSAAGGVTRVPVSLAPGQSLFVIFRRSARPARHVVEAIHSSSTTGPPTRHTLEIRRAVYAAPDGAGYPMDLTARVAALARGGSLLVHATNTFAGGDPAGLHVKELRVEYVYDGVGATAVIRENNTLRLPPSRAEDDSPPSRIVRTAGDAAVSAWQPGSWMLRWSDGATETIDAPEGAQTVSVNGPWRVTFAPHWGGPGTVTFDRLSDWALRPEEGIRHYSGTAEYVTEVQNDPMPAGDLYLDLGGLANLAEVTVNGHRLGVLWKPPWRVLVPPAAAASRRLRITVAVTNLWANRLIGDAALPEAKRIATTTTNPYGAGSPLQASGLFGPVRLLRVPTVHAVRR